MLILHFLFSVDQYEKTVYAYLDGLTEFAKSD